MIQLGSLVPSARRLHLRWRIDPTAKNWPTGTAAVRYLATMTADLAAIARGHGLDVLSYLLDMARVEAENVSRPPDDLD